MTSSSLFVSVIGQTYNLEEFKVHGIIPKFDEELYRLKWKKQARKKYNKQF